jgi:hydrogenase-4 component B
MNYLHLTLLFDPLSIFFLFVIFLVSIPSAIFAIGYLKGDYSTKKIVLNWILFITFIVSMLLVVTVRDAFLFLIVWEIMSLVSYFLVIFDTENDKSIRAGNIYIIMTHIGTAFITAAFLIIFKYAHSFDFTTMQQACQTIPSATRNIIFLCLLVGFGTKAGIVPLHIWLPYAHPQAPSHISSIMSGVMIKTAIYGLIRFVIYILGVNTFWWGNLILILASISCLVGVMYALMEHDLKKLLAYHSVENIGIILLGVGASMVFLTLNMPLLAVLAMTAGLYHLINHAIFKSLLFLCSGSVYKATGLRDMEKLGGLIKTMPWTAATFLIGAMAISALPPLNGFISEWLTLQALFSGTLYGATGVKILMSLYAAVLALTGGLAAACFVKAFGITFLAAPRSEKAKQAHEVSSSMIYATTFMAALTFVFGLLAVPIIKQLSYVAEYATGASAGGFNFTLNNLVITPLSASGIYLSSPLITLLIISIILFTLAAMYFVLGRQRVSTHKTWGCGYYHLDQRTEYTATAFSKPFRIAFSFFYRPYRRTEQIKESDYHVKSLKYETSITPVFKKYIYESVLKRVFGTAHFLSKLQSGSIHFYLAYIFVTILLLIIFMGKF